MGFTTSNVSQICVELTQNIFVSANIGYLLQLSWMRWTPKVNHCTSNDSLKQSSGLDSFASNSNGKVVNTDRTRSFVYSFWISHIYNHIKFQLNVCKNYQAIAFFVGSGWIAVESIWPPKNMWTILLIDTGTFVHTDKNIITCYHRQKKKSWHSGIFSGLMSYSYYCCQSDRSQHKTWKGLFERIFQNEKKK